MNLGKKLALLFLFLGFGSAMAQEAEVLLKAHHQKLKEAMLYTLEVAEKMPEAQYGYRPTPEEMSFGEQLLHLGDNLVWLSSN